MRFCKTDDPWDVYQSKSGIRWRLNPHKFGIWTESGENGIVIFVLEVHVRAGDTLVLASNALNVTVGSTIDIVDAENMSVGSKDVDHRSGGCRSRSKSETEGTSLDGSKGGLEGVPVGVSRARVLESLIKRRHGQWSDGKALWYCTRTLWIPTPSCL